MITPMEAKTIVALESINDALNELVKVGNELVAANLRIMDVMEKTIKRQGSKDTSFKEFAEELKVIAKRLLAPPPLPEPLLPSYEPPRIRHEIKIVHLADYIHNRERLEPDLNNLVAEENYILAGITDYHIILHRGVKMVDAEFTDDGGKVDVQ